MPEPAARADVIAAVLGALVVLGALGIASGWHPIARIRRMQSHWSTAPAGGIAVSALSILALTGVSGHAHSVGSEHREHGEHFGHAGVTTTVGEELMAGNVAACRSSARVASDAALAKALAKASGKQSAIERAERGGQKRLTRVLAACDGTRSSPPAVEPAPNMRAPAQPAVRSEPKAGDGHRHTH